MENEYVKIGNKISTEKYTLGKKIFALQDESYGRKLKLSRVKENQILDWRAELLEYIGKALYQDSAKIKIAIRDWAKATGHLAISNGIPLEESFRVLTLFRRVSFEAALHEIHLNSNTTSSMEVNRRIDSIIEEVSYTYNDICIAYRSQRSPQDGPHSNHLQISFLPITDTLALLPISGTLYGNDAEMMLKETLDHCYAKQLTDIVIDLSGVSNLNPTSVHSLTRMNRALMYSGIKMFLCGIQPSTAYSLTSNGINIQGLTIFGTLKQALLHSGIRQTLPG
ncbi:MAG: STAS domain-containing protein [Anaerobacillus sp.]